jgi:predicted ATP-grasp superfamily ATP-dependent carboligase
VLVACPTAAGTLAAVRVLGLAGIPVSVCGERGLSAARLSRFTRSYWTLDDTSSEASFLAGLRLCARQAAKHVLLPASDETAWLFAKHAEELGRDLTVYTPCLAVVEATVDKHQLWRGCKGAGVPTLPSWFPESLADIPKLAEPSFPVVIKPRQHLFRTRQKKGVVVESAAALEREFALFVRQEQGDGAAATERPLPMIQSFVKDAVENVLSITGFIDRSGTRVIMSAARKVLQRSRPVGIGLAFEGIALPRDVAEDALRLCRHLGFFGIFEIEFVWHDGAWRLIDFNPRFYHEMALDIARGMPLPLFAYFDACGSLDELDAALAAARVHGQPALCFSDMFTTTLVMALRMSLCPSAARRAFAWHWRCRRNLVDATFDRLDPLPFLGHALCELRLGLEQLPALFMESRRTRTQQRARWQFESIV